MTLRMSYGKNRKRRDCIDGRNHLNIWSSRKGHESRQYSKLKQECFFSSSLQDPSPWQDVSLEARDSEQLRSPTSNWPD